MQRFFFIVLLTALTLNQAALARDSLNVSCVNRMYMTRGYRPFTVHDTLIYTMGSIAETNLNILSILNIADLENIIEVGFDYFEGSDPSTIKANNQFMAIGMEDYITIANTEDPTAPEFLSRMELEGTLTAIELRDDFMFVCSESPAEFAIVSLREPEIPEIIGSLELENGAEPNRVVLQDDAAFLGGDKLRRINISDPENPSLVSTYDLPNHDIELADDIAFIVQAHAGLAVLDISDAEEIREIAWLEGDRGGELILKDDVLLNFIMVEIWIDDPEGGWESWEPHIQWLDVSNLEDIGEIEIDECPFPWSNSMYLIGENLVWQWRNNKFIFAEFENHHGITSYRHKLINLGEMAVYDNQLWVGMDNGIFIHDLSDRAKPELIDEIILDHSVDYYLIRHNLACAIDRFPSNDDIMKIVSYIDLNGREHEPFSYEYDFYVVGKDMDDEGYVYFGASGRHGPDSLMIFDANDTENVSEVSSLYLNANVQNLTYANERIYGCIGSEGVLIIDVSDRENPEEISRLRTNGVCRDIKIVGDLGILVDDDFRILDLSDQDRLSEISNLEIPGSARWVLIQDSIAIVRTWAGHGYEAPYSGIYHVDFSDTYNPEIVAYYETHRSMYYGTIESPYLYAATSGYLGVYASRDYVLVDENPTILLPNHLSLSAYPNPFNSRATVNYQLPVTSPLSIDLLDMSGRRVDNLLDADAVQGFHTLSFDASHLPSGAYFLMMNAEGYQQTVKLTLMR